MEFKGTIIITDPCYIVKDPVLPENLVYPDCDDYITHEKDEDYPDYKNGFSETLTKELSNYQEAIHKYYKEHRKYDDWERCNYGEDIEVLGIKNYISEETIYGDWFCTTYKTDEDPKELIDRIAIYNKEDDDGERIMAELDELDNIGEFCADAGIVSVFLLDEVLKYNPEISKWIDEHKWCVTKIDDFDGEVEYYVDDNSNAHIYGIGNINFATFQTGL